MYRVNKMAEDEEVTLFSHQFEVILLMGCQVSGVHTLSDYLV